MGSFAFEKHYRVKELAVLWGLSPKTVSRLFAEEAGVIRIANDATSKRRYGTLSIPESIASRVHEKLGSQPLQENPIGTRTVRVIRLGGLDSSPDKNGRTIIKIKSRK